MEMFLLGIIFSMVIFPILEGSTTLVLTFLEMLKGFMGRVISKNNNFIEQCHAEPAHRVIGFAAPEDDSDYEEDGEDDD